MCAQDIQKLGVVGMGFMGGGIAQVIAMSGRDVTVFDVRGEAVDKGMERIRWSLGRLVSKGWFGGEPEEVLGRIRVVTDLEAFRDVHMVIEAVYESIPVKEELLGTLDRIVSPDAVVGSNTSSIPMDVLSKRVTGPHRFLGTHFFGPVPLMQLVELVMGPETSEATLQRTRDVMRSIGKTSIVVRKPSPGFLVNRIFMVAAMEAMRCLFEGIGTPEDIDTGLRLGYGWSAGPFEVMDNAGLDIMAGVFQVMGGELPPQIRNMLDQGHLGRKTGRGFYRYDADGKRILNET